uniref:TM2 domain containing 1 n=1 Tax=Eptatretus burgeri TaxID=7764 RepID=A0A8C4NLL0_EPTBU
MAASWACRGFRAYVGLVAFGILNCFAFSADNKKCDQLLNGQFICLEPVINDSTQEPVDCYNNTAQVDCIPAPNITCIDSQGILRQFDGETMAFQKSIICRNTSGYRYTVAVALSLFLGWLGADRFYLGYPALGLLKFCTIGFCGIGSLIDFVLIVTQVVGPSDGSSYIIDYYGARLTRLVITNETYRVPHTEL